MAVSRRIGLFLSGVLFLACLSAPAPADPPDELDAAIRSTSNYLNEHLPGEKKLVILNIQSEYPALSEYIIDELIANTVNDRVFSVVDRQQLDIIRAELDFHISGEVDDETAQALGRIAGAQIIVSGAVSRIGDLYRLRVRALKVESAQIEGQFNQNIPESPTIAALTRSEATAYAGAPASSATPAVPEPPTSYRIGDIGPAGGLIFYDRGNRDEGWQYLEAASRDAGQAQWSGGASPLSRTGAETGTGKGNTDYIVRYLRERGESDCAAQICLSYSQGGYDDWFLPSKDELNLLYTNLELKNLGDFSIGWYWSSSQAGDNGAWCQRFSDGEQSSYAFFGNTPARKNNSHSVRPVRAF
jgi:hypothetical protein